MVSHGTFEEAVQLHPVPMVTVTDAVLDAATALDDVGESVATHADAAWFTVKAWPAMVIVPLRAAPVLAATE
jgi:hypothetical protein